MTRKSEGQGQLNALSIICIDRDFTLMQSFQKFYWVWASMRNRRKSATC